MSEEKPDRNQKKEEPVLGEAQSLPQKGKLDFFELSLIAFILVIAVLSAVMVTRLINNSPVFISGESYYNLRMGESLKEKSFLSQDPVQGRAYAPNPFHYLIAGFSLLFSSDAASLFLPIILGLLAALLLLLMLIRIGVGERESAFTVMLVAITPAFMTLYTGLYLVGFSLPLSLLACWLIFKDKHSRKQEIFEMLTALLIIVLLAATNLMSLLVTLLVILLLSIYMSKWTNSFLPPFIVSIASVMTLKLLYNYPLLARLGFHALDLNSSFSVFGASFGFDIFLMMLFAIGFILLWNSNKDARIFHLLVLLIISASLFNTTLRIFSSMIMPAYCVASISYFYKRKWELNIIRNGTAILVICSLVFACLNQLTVLVNSEPRQELRDAVVTLKSAGPGTVISDANHGFMIQFFSGKKSLLDDDSKYYDNHLELELLQGRLMNYSRMKELTPEMGQAGARYLLLTPRMKEELWESRSSGLWFLVRHSEKFRSLYEKEGVELWEYLGV